MTLLRREKALVSRGFDPDDFYVLREKKPKRFPRRIEIISQLLKNPGGLTCEELEARLLSSHQTVSARLRELVKRKIVKDSRVRRPTKSGRPARVYVVR